MRPSPRSSGSARATWHPPRRPGTRGPRPIRSARPRCPGRGLYLRIRPPVRDSNRRPRRSARGTYRRLRRPVKGRYRRLRRRFRGRAPVRERDPRLRFQAEPTLPRWSSAGRRSPDRARRPRPHRRTDPMRRPPPAGRISPAYPVVAAGRACRVRHRVPDRGRGRGRRRVHRRGRERGPVRRRDRRRTIRPPTSRPTTRGRRRSRLLRPGPTGRPVRLTGTTAAAFRRRPTSNPGPAVGRFSTVGPASGGGRDAGRGWPPPVRAPRGRTARSARP